MPKIVKGFPVLMFYESKLMVEAFYRPSSSVRLQNFPSLRQYLRNSKFLGPVVEIRIPELFELKIKCGAVWQVHDPRILDKYFQW